MVEGITDRRALERAMSHPEPLHVRRDRDLRCLELTRPWAGLPAGAFIRIDSHGATPHGGPGIEYRGVVVTDQGLRPFVGVASRLVHESEAP